MSFQKLSHTVSLCDSLHSNDLFGQPGIHGFFTFILLSAAESHSCDISSIAFPHYLLCHFCSTRICKTVSRTPLFRTFGITVIVYVRCNGSWQHVRT